ncbi:MAG: hypothetical protein HYU41_16895 [Candidatus Rokubacteria bacterium]|nr:hypothetical protein [Candidatus Rokubacteria bacterium]
MADPSEVFADQLTLLVGPFGCTIVFAVSAAPGSEPAHPKTVASVRVSLEHLKAMAFLLHKGIKDYERENVRVPFSDKTLSILATPRAEWEAFWDEK